MKASDDPRPVGSSLERLVADLAGGAAPSAPALFVRWPEIAGEAVAARARPLSLDGDVLTVAVEDPAWATQLRFLTADLLRSIEQVVGPGVVRRVEVRVRRAR